MKKQEKARHIVALDWPAFCRSWNSWIPSLVGRSLWVSIEKEGRKLSECSFTFDDCKVLIEGDDQVAKRFKEFVFSQLNDRTDTRNRKIGL